MLLERKVAVVYGGGGAIGGAIARAFAREGAHVALAGRTRARLDAVAADIAAAGGSAEVAEVDALDAAATAGHADAVAERHGGIDVALNAVGIVHVQGTPLAELDVEDFLHPVAAYARTNFVTARAVAPHLRAGGALLTISTPGAKLAFPGVLGYAAACAAIEAFSRVLAAELAPAGVRVVCLRPDAIPEAAAAGSHSRAVFAPVAERMGTTVDGLLEEGAARTLLGRFPTLAEVADAAAFLASDRAGAMTGTVANLTCGSVVD